MIVSLVVADLIAPSKVLTSLAVTAVLCAFIGLGAAVVVMPAALVLLRRPRAGLQLRRAGLPRPAWDAAHRRAATSSCAMR